ncbi:AOX, alternative oxidase mitochondrial precursor [Mycena pura]|uniref:Alternative oxidase n=1 Tax=Mycena pura TaxID=153505 RepID=A0AAD6Y8U1_9AGAR|nr:AOX, alternative oxidase mitochondrial precursor [Mycena pura]
MLRTTLIRLAPAQRAALCAARPRLVGCAFMSTTPSATPSRKHEALEQPAAGPSRLSTPDAVSTVPTMVRGDWVLFHPVYTTAEMKAVEVLHREAKTVPDKLAYGLVRLARWGFDFVSRYKHKPMSPAGAAMTVEELRKAGHLLDERGWLNRILFLETIAGVPGMVAATLRHLTSLRLMRRDSGWIHTCLEEAENERMHLMTFMTLRDSSIWFRALILGAQGVFYNLFFLAYIVSPRTCHRFVGHLEEEAVLTYTRCIEDLEAGRIPEWTDKPAPGIAIDYWRLPADAKLLDVIYAVRSDESTHRFVNHSLANLEAARDVNPFALREPDMFTKGRKIAFDRDEAERYVRESHSLMEQKKREDA